MKVGLCITDAAGSGLGNYTTELAKSLEERPGVTVKRIHLPTYSIPVFAPYISTSYGVKKELEKYDDEVDVFHLSAQTQAAGIINTDLSTPVVVTVHDIIPLVSKYDNLLLRSFAKLYECGLSKADRIIAISKHTKMDLEEAIDYPKDKINVIYPSIDTDKFEQGGSEQGLKGFEISEPYLLYVGSQTTKKNIKTVISSLKYLPDEISLVIAGDPGILPGNLTKYQSLKHGVRDRVSQVGFVDLETLLNLYESALAFVFPSKYEGFGRPPLEAMSVGTPVIATSATAVPEILGDAALFCDPDDPREWAETISSLYEGDLNRADLINRGYNRITKFSWETCAEKTVTIYQESIQNK